MKKTSILLIGVMLIFTASHFSYACDNPPCEEPFDQHAVGEAEVAGTHNLGDNMNGGFGTIQSGFASFEAWGKDIAEGEAKATGNITGHVETDCTTFTKTVSQTKVDMKAKAMQDVGPANATVSSQAERGSWATKNLDDLNYGYSGNSTGSSFTATKSSDCAPIELNGMNNPKGWDHVQFNIGENQRDMKVENHGWSNMSHDGITQNASSTGQGNYGGGLFTNNARGNFDGSWNFNHPGSMNSYGKGYGTIDLQKKQLSNGMEFRAKTHVRSKVGQQ